MNYPYLFGRTIRAYLTLAGIILVACNVHGQKVSTGTIEGRVQNVVKGDYVDKARLVIDGTDLETFTDPLGQYRFTNVPAGSVRLRASYTGLEPQTQTVMVNPGETSNQQFDLLTSAATAERNANSALELDKFVVNAVKDTNDAAITINEQRYSTNMKTVVSTEEFGNIAEGNLGEFLKFVPGLTVEYTGGEARQIQLNGAFGQYTNILMNGMGMASAASSGTARTIELEQISINNVSRIEYVRSPTPESPGNSLSGYINMVPRSAFERSRPSGTYQVFMEMGENSFLKFSKTPGPQDRGTRKVNPGATFNYINPVNSRFGFTLSGSTSGKDLVGTGFTFERFGTSNFGVPPVGSPYNSSNPYPQQYVISDNPIFIQRSSWASTLDFKAGPNDVLSLGMSWAVYSGKYGGRDVVLNAGSGNVLANGPLSAGPDFVHGRPGQGSIAINSGGSGAAHKFGTTYMPTLTWRHNGPIWILEGGAGYSHATNHYRDVSEGYSSSVVLNRTNVTINLDGVGLQAPSKVTILDNAPEHVGESVDFRKLSSYNVLRQGSGERDSYDLKKTAYGKVGRLFDLPWTSLNTKVGFDVQQQVRAPKFNLATWVPVAGTSSANGAYLVDTAYLPHALPYAGGPMEWASQWKAFQDLKSNPQNWVLSGATAANPTAGEGTKLRDQRNRSKHAQETVSAGFFQGDLRFFNRRLQISTGLRAEQTNVKGEGPLTDASRGKDLLVNSLAYVQATVIERGAHSSKEYLTFFPDANASFAIAPNLIARGAVYTSIGRPDFNTYISGSTVPDLETLPTPTGPFITVTNPLIKPWTSVTQSASLEYYFPGVGLFSIDGWHRKYQNFIVASAIPSTPELLEAIGVSQSYLGYYVSTQRNLPDTMYSNGWNVSYKQELKFLPDWARGVTVFANYSRQRFSGTGVNASGIFVALAPHVLEPYTANWGLSLRRPQFDVQANWNYKAQAPMGYFAATNSSFFYTARTFVDLTVNYRPFKSHSIGLYAAVANLRGEKEQKQVWIGPGTPTAAQERRELYFGPVWTLGLKGSF